MKIATNYFGLQTNHFSSAATNNAQTPNSINCFPTAPIPFSQSNNNDDKQTYLNIAKNLTSIGSFLLACLEVAFGLLQNTTISRIFALTSSAEATGAASLNLPHSDKIMAFVQFAIGSLIASELVLPKNNNAGSQFLNRLAQSSKTQFSRFAKKVNMPEEKLLNRVRFSLPILGLAMAISKGLISKYSSNPIDKDAFHRSSVIDVLCFLESMLLFVPPKFSRIVEPLYQLGTSGKLLLDSAPALLGLTSAVFNKN